MMPHFFRCKMSTHQLSVTAGIPQRTLQIMGADDSDRGSLAKICVQSALQFLETVKPAIAKHACAWISCIDLNNVLVCFLQCLYNGCINIQIFPLAYCPHAFKKVLKQFRLLVAGNSGQWPNRCPCKGCLRYMLISIQHPFSPRLCFVGSDKKKVHRTSAHQVFCIQPPMQA